MIMKQIMTILAILCLGFTVKADNDPQEYTSDISQIRVYMTGANVQRSATVDIKAGKNTILLTGLSPKIDANSIWVDLDPKDITILSISSRTNFMSSSQQPAKIKLLQDSVVLFNDEVEMLTAQQQTLLKEKELLFKNQSIGGTENGVSVEEIEKSADFFRARSFSINKLLFDIQKQINKANQRLTLIRKQLNELNAQYNPPSSEIQIILVSNRACKATIDFSYLVWSCGWAPKYDIRAENQAEKIDFIYRANIFNNTGIDWEDVKLILSTADPMQGAERPNLDKWALNYSYEIDQGYDNNKLLNNEQQRMGNMPTGAGDGGILDGQTGSVTYQSVQVGEFNAEFEIKNPYSILADSKPYTVDVSEHKLPATYENFAIPKLDRDAFLLAKITGWNELNLITGNASIYFDGAYIGKSYINTNNMADTMKLSLGRDNKIIIKRTNLVEQTKKQVIGNKIKENFVYDIYVKNNRDKIVNIEIQDQIPISQNDEIEVTIDEISGAIYDEFTGKLRWNLTIEPGETVKLQLGYTIKYPKNKQIQKQRTRSQAAPMFM
jgi:uncharacterized protein (TIGR02231 family)